MINNNLGENAKPIQDDLEQRRRYARRTALIAGCIALMFYAGFILLGLFNQ